VRRAAFALVLVVLAGGCAARRFSIPTGPGAPVPDAAAIWSEVTSGCDAVRWYSSNIHLSGGRSGGPSLSGISVFTGFDRTGRLRLEGNAAGRRVFTLAGTADRATLYLPREREVIIDRTDVILEALTDVPITSTRLLATLTGCLPGTPAMTGATRYGDVVRLETTDGRLFVERAGNVWRPRATVTDAIEVDYRQFLGGWPSELVLWTAAGVTPEARLHMRLDNVQINSFTMDDRAFTVEEVPGDAIPVSLDELRARLRRGGG